MIKNITEFKPGDIIKISCVECGLRLNNRLCDLGIFNGAQIEIFKNDNQGPIILKIFNAKMAFGRGEAKKIYGQKV